MEGSASFNWRSPRRILEAGVFNGGIWPIRNACGAKEAVKKITQALGSVWRFMVKQLAQSLSP